MSGVLMRFRVMAIIAGVMSLLLWFGYMPAKYILNNPSLIDLLTWVPIVHGYLYPIYILTAIQFAVVAEFPIKRMFGFILAGTLPVASLIAERRVVKQYS
jgi:integral membrane protein